MKIIKIAQQNITLPPDRNIDRNTVYVSSNRLIKVIPRENINKEYLVRVYRYEDDMYSVVGWNGRRGGTLRPQPKYFGGSDRLATLMAQQLIASKRAGGYQEDRTAIVDSVGMEYMGRPELPSARQTRTPTPAPTPPAEPLSRTPSIRLQPEYVPNATTEYIAARKVVDGLREFLIMVYDYKDGWYSTIEWYTPFVRGSPDYRIHPKLITRDRVAAIHMSQRLVDEKVSQGGWTEVTDITRSLQLLNRGRPAQQTTTIRPPATDQQLPTIEHFINEMRGTGMSRMGKYRYSMGRRQSPNNGWGYDVFEREWTPDAEIATRSIFLQESQNFTQEAAIYQAAEWATERRDQLSSVEQEKEKTQDSPSKESPKPPSPPRELTEQEKRWEELMSSSMAWYKTAYSQPPEDWYMDLGENIGKELKGYFKFVVKVGADIMGVYNIWWEGLDSDVRITKHDMPMDEIEKYKNAIMSTAKAESLKAYKEVMLSYGER